MVSAKIPACWGWVRLSAVQGIASGPSASQAAMISPTVGLRVRQTTTAAIAVASMATGPGVKAAPSRPSNRVAVAVTSRLPIRRLSLSTDVSSVRVIRYAGHSPVVTPVNRLSRICRMRSRAIGRCVSLKNN
jgi:hypothetical protein